MIGVIQERHTHIEGAAIRFYPRQVGTCYARRAVELCRLLRKTRKENQKLKLNSGAGLDLRFFGFSRIRVFRKILRTAFVVSESQRERASENATQNGDTTNGGTGRYIGQNTNRRTTYMASGDETLVRSENRYK